MYDPKGVGGAGSRMPNSLMRSSAPSGLGSVRPALPWDVIQFTPHAIPDVV